MKKLEVKKVRDLGPQFTDNVHRMVGQDGAYSIPLSKKTLWFFGDTLIGERPTEGSLWYVGEESIKPGELAEGWDRIDEIISNTGLLLKHNLGSKGFTDFKYICDEYGNIKQLVKPLPDENFVKERIWCLHGFPLNNKLYLFYQKVEIIEDETNLFPVSFNVIGTGLSVGDTTNWDFTRLVLRGSTIIWPGNQPQFGAVSFKVHEEERIYLYGVLFDHMTGIQNCYLARVRWDNVEDFSSYEYLVNDVPTWSPKVYNANPIFTGPPNELSVSRNDYLGCFLAVHSNNITGEIVARTTDHLWGSWSPPILLYKAERLVKNPLPYPPLIYAAKEHPELAKKGGKILYITYIEFEEYYPHLLEVELT